MMTVAIITVVMTIIVTRRILHGSPPLRGPGLTAPYDGSPEIAVGLGSLGFRVVLGFRV